MTERRLNIFSMLFILLYDLDTSFGINWGGKGNVDYNFTPDSGAAWI